MEEEIILEVAKILQEWNPLGDRANAIDQLEGYRYEAIDIIATIDIMPGSNRIEKAIAQVLSGAFNLELDKTALSKAAKDVGRALGKSN